MHPTLEQLVALRDGDAPDSVREHAASCAQCSAELERLQKVVEELRALPLLPPTSDLWPSLKAQVVRERRRSWMAAATVAASLLLAAGLIAGVILLKREAPQPAPAAVAQKAPQQDKEIQPLIAESQRLENVLRKASSGNPVMSGKTAGAIANIEDNIAILDLQISILSGASEKRDQVKRLWQQRVKLLQALVQVHTSRGDYAQL